MKSLLLIRHAKSSWNDLTQKDFDRPLNARGKKDASAMAKRVRKEWNVSLDAIVASPSKRTIETAGFFAEEFAVRKKHIIQVPALYEPTIAIFYETIRNFNEDFKTIALFSHDNGITYFVNELTNVHVDDMPTCGVFALRILTEHWKDFPEADKEFWFFDYPKNIS